MQNDIAATRSRPKVQLGIYRIKGCKIRLRQNCFTLISSVMEQSHAICKMCSNGTTHRQTALPRIARGISVRMPTVADMQLGGTFCVRNAVLFGFIW